MLEKFKIAKEETHLMQGKAAFTLAEVLITLAVIGIVAALTIGIFLPKIHSAIRARQIATAEVKFTKAMEQMALNNAVGPYYETTQEFVDELQNYLKVSKVCANDKLEECFGYDKLLLSNGEEFELAEIKSGENLGKTADNTEYLETVGLVTIDGTGMILSWNKKCDILEPKVYQWGNNTNETTSCVAAIMDINLDKSPNRINKDVALFRAESPSKSEPAGFQLGGVTWGVPFQANVALTNADCTANKSTYGITNCRSGNDDYWGGAMKTCIDQEKRLPTMAELGNLAAYLYNKNAIEAWDDISDTLDKAKLTNFSNILPTSGFALWSNYVVNWSPYPADYRYFDTSSSNSNHSYRNDSSRWAVCVQ